jgi:phosphoribosylformylglycinamidine cyclo-ligase
VLAGPGFFGSLFELKGFKQPMLVASADGVGTKLKIATTLNRHQGVGVDLVNHCVNDIFTCGAEPLFFLDYIAMGKLKPEQVAEVIKGLSKACLEAGCALIGGETAEMPGVYSGQDYDLAGFIVGAVEKGKMITGSDIITGDAIIGLPSSGLHTNGYSLVRQIFDISPSGLNRHYPELGRNLGDEFLEPHRSYYHQLKKLLPFIKGMAHITGGGLTSNIPRTLPAGLAVRIDSSSWQLPPIFRLIRGQGNIDTAEMYRIFNMGIGMAVICSPQRVRQIIGRLPKAEVIGEVVEQMGEARVIIN